VDAGIMSGLSGRNWSHKTNNFCQQHHQRQKKENALASPFINLPLDFPSQLKLAVTGAEEKPPAVLALLHQTAENRRV